jgi:hypothetical protein
VDPPTLDELVVAAEPESWEALGFAVDGDRVAIGTTRVRLAGPDAGRGIISWSLHDLVSTDLDGLRTERSHQAPPTPARHPNGALAIDHVVAFTPDLDRSVPALQAAGIPLRRTREADGLRPMRMAFFRIGEAILELVEQPDAPDRSAAARFWGLVVVVEDLEAAVERLGEHAGAVRDAVQAGRRIATVRSSARVGPALALMSRGRP